jgi:hypothetical protein
MINSKIYVITDPILVQSAFRSKALSFEPFMSEFAQRMLDVSDAAMIEVKKIPENDKEPSFMRDMTQEIHGSMTGQHLHKMNAEALNHVALSINNIKDTLEPSSLYLWLRTTLSIATCTALLGPHNPMITDHSLVDALWYNP